MREDHDAPYLVRWYVANIKPHTRSKPARWNDAWVQGTIRFGWELSLVGVAVLIGCVFLPDDVRRWLLLAFGLCTVLVGQWHVRNARAVCSLALRLGKDRGQT